jgi:hypothetical protein
MQAIGRGITIVQCPSCNTQVQVPGGKSGPVICPQCGSQFNAEVPTKKPSYGGLQRFLIDPSPPYSPARVLERFLEEAKKWPKKMLADAHVQRVLADTRRSLEWARKNPIKDVNAGPEAGGDEEKRVKDSGLFQSKRKTE